MKRLIFFLLTFLSLDGHTTPLELKRSFVTDGCTGYPDGTWRECCVQHDLALWAGGTSLERELADRELKSCVEEHGGQLQANLMWLGVRIGSYSPVKLPGKQWGNAWGDETRVTPLTRLEVEHLEHTLYQQGQLDAETIDEFITRLYTR